MSGEKLLSVGCTSVCSALSQTQDLEALPCSQPRDPREGMLGAIGLSHSLWSTSKVNPTVWVLDNPGCPVPVPEGLLGSLVGPPAAGQSVQPVWDTLVKLPLFSCAHEISPRVPTDRKHIFPSFRHMVFCTATGLPRHHRSHPGRGSFPRAWGCRSPPRPANRWPGERQAL